MLLDYTRQRLEMALQEVARLGESEFPNEESRDALQRLESVFRLRLAEVLALDQGSDPATVRETCARAVDSLVSNLILLGFILRSTNVRNAFEVCRPMSRLARELLEPETTEAERRTKVVLSSEWQYSPITYSAVPYLPGFVLIGLPASESDNPLLIPLAGHELGHALWTSRACEAEFAEQIREQVIQSISNHWGDYQEAFPAITIPPEEITVNLFALETWRKASQWAMKQAEETFCDCVAIRLFGVSYLHAFAYLLAPKSSGKRRLNYPNLNVRARDLVRAASAYGLEPPGGYAEMFDDQPVPDLTQGDSFQLSIADEVLSSTRDLLTGKAQLLVPKGFCLATPPKEISRILAAFGNVAPAQRIGQLADIVNAAWAAHHDTHLWEDLPHIQSDRHAVLRDLVLKNIEVLEIEQILQEGV